MNQAFISVPIFFSICCYSNHRYKIISYFYFFQFPEVSLTGAHGHSALKTVKVEKGQGHENVIIRLPNVKVKRAMVTFMKLKIAKLMFYVSA